MPSESPNTPWIERAVASPAVRAGYLSLVAHVVVCIILAILALETRRTRPPEPIQLRFGEAEAPGDEHLVDVALGDDLPHDEAQAAAAAPTLESRELPVDDVPLVAVLDPTATPAADADDPPIRLDPTGLPARAVSVRVGGAAA